MARETGEDETVARTSTINDAFDALANQTRRRLLFGLEDANPSHDGPVDPMELLADDAEGAISGSTQIELVHVHLPKLDSQGFVDWDREAGELDTGDEWDEIEPILSVICEHRDEFPDGLL